MNKKTKNTIKKWAIIASIILFAVFLLGTIMNISRKSSPLPPLPEEISYSEEPTDWIDDHGKTKEIRIDEITKGKGYVEGGTQQYVDEEEDLWTAFKMDGIYQGDIFALEYQDENNKTKMRINKKMNPYDGIIEGFIVAEIENASEEIIWIHIFVDEDWKQQIESTKIFFGMFYQYWKQFKFTEVSKGIYMDKVMDDPSRHIEDFAISAGGIIVGDVIPEDIINNNIENKTLMRFS
jgi:hypothetical protein